MRIVCFFLLLLSSQIALSQDSIQFTEASPKFDLNFITKGVFELNLSEEALEKLAQSNVSYVFTVSESGDARLNYLIGVSDDSLRKSLADLIPDRIAFNPATKDSVPVTSNYYWTIYFARVLEQSRWTNRYKMIKRRYSRKEFSILNTSLKSQEILFGMGTSALSGPLHKFLSPAFSMDMEMNYMGKSWFGAGFQMRVNLHKLRQNFQIPDPRPQIERPPTLHLGLNLSSRILEEEKKHARTSLQVNYSLLNLIVNDAEEGNNGITYTGFSIAWVNHYALSISSGRPVLNGYDLRWAQHYLNFQFGIHYINLGNPNASGWMYNIGIGYKLISKGISSYRLTPEAFIR